MIERIIHFSIKNKFIVGLFITALVACGIYSVVNLPMDVTPDITNNQVQIISLAPSLAVQEVESSITAPIEVAVANIPNIIELRSISRLGLSVITIVFKDKIDIYWARQQISEQLKEAEENIPKGICQTSLAPISTGLGEIYQYRLAVSKGYESKYSPMDLRTLQDWTIRREMLGTPGVADINSYGGFVKQYEIAVNPERMKSLGLSLDDIFKALERNNENTGSAYIEKNHAAYFIRGIGLVKSLDDIGNIVVQGNSSGMPILIKDLADVRYGNATRYGAFIVDKEEAVGGVVMMLKNANAKEVIKNVENRMRVIQKSLPEGITIQPFLNRSDLVNRTIGTVSRNLIEGALIVIFILVLFLGNMRAGFIVASVIPLAMLFAVSMMSLFGISGNLMSLGAIDFGLIVDGAVIIVENAVAHIGERLKTNVGTSHISQSQMDETVFQSAKRMMSSATFGQIIILIVYIPIMTLAGIEGKMFRPMAQVVTFALIGAAILSLTYVPMMSALCLKKTESRKSKISGNLMKAINKGFNPVILYALRHKLSVTLTAIALFIGSLILFGRFGGEFVPQLEEGDLAAGVITLQGGSLSNTIEEVKKANKVLLKFPEVKHVVCKVGAGEIPTDPTPLETGDYIITLKDKNQWTTAHTREGLIEKMEEALKPIAGVQFEFQQPIQMRQNELISGSKQDIAVKIFGDDLVTLTDKANEIKRLIQNIPGIEDINIEKVTGLEQIEINYNRERLAQYGLSVNDVSEVLRTAFAGSQAGIVYDGEKRFGLVVRLAKDYRSNLDDIRNLTIPLPRGGQLPIEQVASVAIKEGPAQISRENTRRRITIGFNVRNNDVESVINEVQNRIDSRVKMPTGYYVSYGGQFQNLQEAKSRLGIAVPIALILIFILLYFAFRSVKEALLIYTAVPMSVIGGILALWIRGMNFSISAGIGFIALFGIAVLNGIVLISEFNQLEKGGMKDIRQRVLTGLKTRLRPVLITASAASLGFFPMAISTSAGAEVQKPLATVVIGGLISATLLTLVVLPIFYMYFSTFSFKKIFRLGSTKALTILLLVIGISTGKISAQQRIQLHDVIQLALDSNYAVRSQRYNVQMNKTLKGSSFDLPKTEFTTGYGKLNSYTNDNSIGVSQSFAFPTVYANRYKLAEANVKDSQWSLESTKLEIATQAKRLYWQLVFLRSRQQLLTYQDSLYSELLKTAEVRAKTGESKQLETMSAKSQYLEAHNRLSQIESDIQICIQRLQTLLNCKRSILPADDRLKQLSFDIVTYNDAVNNNPLTGQASQRIETSKMEKKLEKSMMLPDFSIGLSSMTIRGEQNVNGTSRYFGNGYRFNSIQIGVSLPLFYSSFKSKIKAAKFKEQIAITEHAGISNNLLSEYHSLLSEYGKQQINIGFYEKQAVPEAELIIRQATQSYCEGEISYAEYIVNVSRALDIKQNYIDALNNNNQTVISLESITGKIF